MRRFDKTSTLEPSLEAFQRLLTENIELREGVRRLKLRVEELEALVKGDGRAKQAPPWIKPNVKKDPGEPEKKAGAKNGHEAHHRPSPSTGDGTEVVIAGVLTETIEQEAESELPSAIGLTASVISLGVAGESILNPTSFTKDAGYVGSGASQTYNFCLHFMSSNKITGPLESPSEATPRSWGMLATAFTGLIIELSVDYAKFVHPGSLTPEEEFALDTFAVISGGIGLYLAMTQTPTQALEDDTESEIGTDIAEAAPVAVIFMGVGDSASITP